MFPPAVDHLWCPHCAGDLRLLPGRTLGCGNGHRFDVARQGYVNLSAGGTPHQGDSAAMVAARARIVDRGHFSPTATAVASIVEQSLEGRAGDGDNGCAVELGAGTGYHLGKVLDRLPGRAGIALDASRYACRRAAKAHPRIGAVVCDVWAGVPVRTATAMAVLDVFAPRNGAEIRRILGPSGVLVVAAPTTSHLRELVGPLGLVTVDADKGRRVAAELDPHVVVAHRETVEHGIELDHDEVRDLVVMGPSAYHLREDTADHHLDEAIGQRGRPVTATVSVTIALYRRR